MSKNCMEFYFISSKKKKGSNKWKHKKYLKDNTGKIPLISRQIQKKLL